MACVIKEATVYRGDGLSFNDIAACCEHANLRGMDRKHFTRDQAEELAHAWQTCFDHAQRLAIIYRTYLNQRALRQHQEQVAEDEALFIEDPETYAYNLYDTVHPCNPGAANPQNPHCNCAGPRQADEPCGFDGCPNGGHCPDHSDHNDGCQVCPYGYCPDCCGSCIHGKASCGDCRPASNGPKWREVDYDDYDAEAEHEAPECETCGAFIVPPVLAEGEALLPKAPYEEGLCYDCIRATYDDAAE